jgi:hypothetical protein
MSGHAARFAQLRRDTHNYETEGDPSVAYACPDIVDDNFFSSRGRPQSPYMQKNPWKQQQSVLPSVSVGYVVVGFAHLREN